MTEEITEKRSSKKVILIVVLGLVIITILATVGYFAYGNFMKKETTTNTAPQQTQSTEKTEVNSIQNDQDLSTAKENLSKNGKDTTLEDEQKLRALTSQ